MLQADPEAVNRAFSKQAAHFDDDDHANIVLQDLRTQIYQHINRHLKVSSRILELNAGTGIDATYFVKAGHTVHATDLSDGMIRQLESRKKSPGMDRLTVQQLSFEELERVHGNQYDHVFSNFGGLNCVRDLSVIGDKLPGVLKPRGLATFVIMPVVSAWEVATILKGNRHAFRRWNNEGTLAHIEGEHFPTWYHSLSEIKRSFRNFDLVEAEGLAAISPPPYKSQFPVKYSQLYNALRRMDAAVRNYFPFNRWADHIIVTMRLK